MTVLRHLNSQVICLVSVEFGTFLVVLLSKGEMIPNAIFLFKFCPFLSFFHLCVGILDLFLTSILAIFDHLGKLAAQLLTLTRLTLLFSHEFFVFSRLISLEFSLHMHYIEDNQYICQEVPNNTGILVSYLMAHLIGDFRQFLLTLPLV